VSGPVPHARRQRVPDRARRVAFDALRAVNADGAYANLVLPSLLSEREISGRDAAFATELVAGTCRWQGSYDAIIAAAARRRLDTLQPAVLDLLRLGVHQMLAMRVPVHAAVSASVDLAAATVGERVAGLVNAVLRRVAEDDRDGWLTRLSDGLDERDRLALRTAHPRWIVDTYADVLPADELGAALEADNVSPIVTLAVRPGLASVDDLIAGGASPGLHSPFAGRITGIPGELAAVREGRAGVQDEGSQLVAWAVTRAEAPPGLWLDLCAGPGGKTALLTGLAVADQSHVLAVDLTPHRARLVAAATRGYAAAGHAPTVIVADGTRPAWRAGTFSRVLADVPCSGLGALRRRPESRWRRGPDDIEQLHDLQLALLSSAIDAAQPGGVIGYVTCSPHRRETTDVVTETLAGRGDVEVIPAADLMSVPAGAATGPFLQLWPHRHCTDAMFAALLRKRF
jgi:16S rRNA (cytosine967-C5)-methyltransferase